MEQQSHLVGYNKLLKLFSITIHVLSVDIVDPDNYVCEDFFLKIMIHVVNYPRKIYIHSK